MVLQKDIQVLPPGKMLFLHFLAKSIITSLIFFSFWKNIEFWIEFWGISRQ